MDKTILRDIGEIKDLGLEKLVSLVRDMGQNGEPQSKILDWLNAVCIYHKLRLHYEVLPADTDNSSEMCLRDATERDVGTIRSDEGPPNTSRFAFLDKSGQSVGRVIVSSNRDNRMKSSLHFECNGVVIDSRDWTCIAIPPRKFNKQVAEKRVNHYIEQGLYDITEVNDGTVVTLYQWGHPKVGNLWALSTYNSYDVSALRWMGPKTYAELVYELLMEQDPNNNLGVELRYDVLFPGDTRLHLRGLGCRAYCYTIGFRHPNFHPLSHNPKDVWNIQSVDTLSREVFSGPGYGLPYIKNQNPIEESTVLSRIASYKGMKDGFIPSHIRVEDIRELNKKELESARLSISQNLFGLQYYKYGYILRSKNRAITKDCSDLLYESALLKFIQRCFYQQPVRIVQEYLNPDNRMEFNLLKIYLTPSLRKDFISLFPQFRRKFVDYRVFIENLIRLTTQYFIPTKNRPSRVRSPLAVVANITAKRIEKAENIPMRGYGHQGTRFPSQSMLEGIVRYYVERPEETITYLNAMERSKKAASTGGPH